VPFLAHRWRCPRSQRAHAVPCTASQAHSATIPVHRCVFATGKEQGNGRGTALLAGDGKGEERTTWRQRVVVWWWRLRRWRLPGLPAALPRSDGNSVARGQSMRQHNMHAGWHKQPRCVLASAWCCCHLPPLLSSPPLPLLRTKPGNRAHRHAGTHHSAARDTATNRRMDQQWK
jgi:hypothetical protein